MELISKVGFIALDRIDFDVEIYKEKYQRKNKYKIYKDNIVYLEGECPKDYTVQDIFQNNVGLYGFEIKH